MDDVVLFEDNAAFLLAQDITEFFFFCLIWIKAAINHGNEILFIYHTHPNTIHGS